MGRSVDMDAKAHAITELHGHVCKKDQRTHDKAKIAGAAGSQPGLTHSHAQLGRLAPSDQALVEQGAIIIVLALARSSSKCRRQGRVDLRIRLRCQLDAQT